MKKNILITGGTGFLGRHIVRLSKKRKYKVFSPRSYEFNLETGRNINKYISNFKKENITIDCIIHSAVYYGGIGTNQKDPVGLIMRNNKMSTNIFEAAALLGVKKFISVGSACAYPGHITGDLKENNIFNGRPHDSVEAYGFNKRIHLVFQKAFHKQFGMESNQLVLANLYGENDVYTEERSHVISSLIKKTVEAKNNNSNVEAWGSGKPRREFLYVEDAAKVIVESVEFDHDLEPINVNGDEISIKGLLELIAEIVGFEKTKVKWDSTKPDGILRKVLSGSKLQKFSPNFKRTPFKKGLEKTINWYISNKELADSRE